ncbi:MAG: hypothetical protein JHC39_06505 [Lentimicrobium sp.]|nr:hypothetical protein [Lentimicrobium sp.]
MKEFFLFIIIFITSTNSLRGQHNIPEKKDNVILINTSNTAEENFKLFGKFLIDEGFSFASKDIDFLTLTTSEKTSEGGYKYILLISFKDSQILIRAKCNYVMFGSSLSNIQLDWTDWEYAKSRNSPSGIAFKAFEPILKKYNGELNYIKQ